RILNHFSPSHTCFANWRRAHDMSRLPQTCTGLVRPWLGVTRAKGPAHTSLGQRPRSGVWTSCRARTVRNANGVLKQSPRLAHSAYLGSRVRTRSQPQRGCVPSPRSTSCGRYQMTNNDRHVRECSRNPVGVAVVLAREPNVVPQSRDNLGLWDGAPLGLINVQTSVAGRQACAATDTFNRTQRRGGTCSADCVFH